MSVKQRALPLAPEARRKSIIDAVIPLLLENGPNVTTAQIAEAAGIAEGTIFRVFPDKTSLLFEAVKASFDPAPELDQLARIERDLPLEVKLRKTAAILIKRSERVHALVSVLRSLPPPEHSAFHDAHKNAIGANSLLLWGVTRVFQDHSSQLAVEPARAAAAFRGLLFAVSFPLNDPAELMTADEAIEVLLSGVMKDRP
ncbi:MAG TPA: TetR/AcrR family transcriptional regulator [Acidimicrobiia bacterium]|jgi:AcrR family transcriptional regulator|nr:TetR/AcrR family transcriptional regulator [Acidimicrobiia bacterium]